MGPGALLPSPRNEHLGPGFHTSMTALFGRMGLVVVGSFVALAACHPPGGSSDDAPVDAPDGGSPEDGGTVALPPSFPLGMLAVLPGIPRPTDRAQAAAAAIAAAGGSYQRPGVAYEWSLAEPTQGNLSFATAQDSLIAMAESKGLKVLPSLSVGSGWMTLPSGNAKSFPPSDLATVEDPTFGYSRSYHGFVTAWITRYAGHFDWVAIENEENSILFWGGSADEYVRLFKTAAKAIHAVDPHARVTDGGMVSTVWGLCAPKDWLDSGRKSRAEVGQAMVHYFFRAAQTGTSEAACSTGESCLALLADARVVETCARAGAILEGIRDAADGVNFHFYEDWSALPLATGWLKEKVPGKALLTNELGQRGTLAYASSSALSADLFKVLVVGRREGLSAGIYFAADTVGTTAPSPDKVSVLDPDGAERPATATFRLVAQRLSTSQAVRALAEGPTVYHYAFDDRLQALWSTASAAPRTLAAPEGTSGATLVSAEGAESPLPLVDGKVSLTPSPAPVFVVFH